MPYKLYPPGKRGPTWYVRGTDSSGEYEAATGKETERAAQRWVEEIFLPDRARRRVPGAGESVGFRTAALHYKAANPQLSTQDIKLVDAVAGEIGDLDCRSVVHATLVAAAEALKPGRSNGTKNRKVIVPAAAVLHYAAKNKWCEYQRLEKFWESRVSNRSPALPDTLAKLFEHLADPPEELAPQWEGVDPNIEYKKILLAMLYETGLRITNLLRVEWPKIDLQEGKVGTYVSKNDTLATVNISSVIISMLANLPEAEKVGRLFPWETRSGVYPWLKRARKRAGVHYTPHLSRHALATDAGKKRIPDAEAAKLGVWLEPRSLHRYQHVEPEPIAGRDAGFMVDTEPKKTGTG